MPKGLRGRHSTSILISDKVIKVAEKLAGFKGCSLGEIKKSSNRSKPGIKIKEINPAVLEIKAHSSGNIQKMTIFLESGTDSKLFAEQLTDSFKS